MSTGNLRQTLPEINSIISETDRIIVETASKGTVTTEFGNLIFDKSNFEIANDLEDNILLTQEISGDIIDYVEDRLSTINVPEILCLYYKEFTNSTGLTIGQEGFATTDLSLNFFQVSTIQPVEIDNSIEISKDMSIGDGPASENYINLSTGIYKVECVGSFTQSGPAGRLLPSGLYTGNGDRGHLVLELFKDNLPTQSLLISTPIITHAPDITITASPSTWCGTQAEWEAFQYNNYEIDSTHTTYMYGYISLCEPSNIRFKIHTAGSYVIGYTNPDNDTDLPPALYNPIQLIFEKVTNNPFEFDVTGPESKFIIGPPLSGFTPSSAAAPGQQQPDDSIDDDDPSTPRKPRGQRIFRKPGKSKWVVPQGVTSISLVAVGAGGGGAACNDRVPNGGNGGDLRWRNDFKVTPGSTLRIDVGAGGTSFRSNIDNLDTPGTDGGDTEITYSGKVVLRAAGGVGGRAFNATQPPNKGSTNTISKLIGGGDGGRGGTGAVPEEATAGGGGGGAGGYTGDGGRGGNFGADGRDGKGGAGGGGSGGKGTGTAGGGGGGVGLFGEGINGAGGNTPPSRANGKSGRTGSRNLHEGIDLTERTSFGFNYGGGGGGKGEFMGAEIGRSISNKHGGDGAVRIIWGPGRSFPNNAR